MIYSHSSSDTKQEAVETLSRIHAPDTGPADGQEKSEASAKRSALRAGAISAQAHHISAMSIMGQLPSNQQAECSGHARGANPEPLRCQV